MTIIEEGRIIGLVHVAPEKAMFSGLNRFGDFKVTIDPAKMSQEAREEAMHPGWMRGPQRVQGMNGDMEVILYANRVADQHKATKVDDLVEKQLMQEYSFYGRPTADDFYHLVNERLSRRLEAEKILDRDRALMINEAMKSLILLIELGNPTDIVEEFAYSYHEGWRYSRYRIAGSMVILDKDGLLSDGSRTDRLGDLVAPEMTESITLDNVIENLDLYRQGVPGLREWIEMADAAAEKMTTLGIAKIKAHAEKETARKEEKARKGAEARAVRENELRGFILDHGTDNQRARDAEDLLPEEEAEEAYRQYLFEPLDRNMAEGISDIRIYVPLEPSEVCDCNYGGCDVDFDMRAAGSLSEAEFDRLQEIFAVANGILRRGDGVRVFTEPMRYVGESQGCDGHTSEICYRVTVETMGGWSFHKDYV